MDRWSAKWVGDQLTGNTQGVGIEIFSLRLVVHHKWDPPGVNNGPHAVNIFINDLNDEIENTITRLDNL